MPEFGQVKGRFMTVIVDRSDPDTLPEIVPLTGKVTFLLNAARVVEAEASPDPVVYGSLPIVGVLDTNGYLSTPIQDTLTPNYQGVWVLATDSEDFNPTDMQYTVTYDLTLPGEVGTAVPMPTHALAVPAGEVVDLGLVIPPAEAPAMGTAAAEAAAAIAVAALAEMVQSDTIRHIVVITEEDFGAMTPPRPSDTLYIKI